MKVLKFVKKPSQEKPRVEQAGVLISLEMFRQTRSVEKSLVVDAKEFRMINTLDKIFKNRKVG